MTKCSKENWVADYTKFQKLDDNNVQISLFGDKIYEDKRWVKKIIVIIECKVIKLFNGS